MRGDGAIWEEWFRCHCRRCPCGQGLCRKNGTVFILDEIITGFRFALGGAQELFRITPDLAAIGKSMANGFPISAVVGKKDLMKEMDEALLFHQVITSPMHIPKKMWNAFFPAMTKSWGSSAWPLRMGV